MTTQIKKGTSAAPGVVGPMCDDCKLKYGLNPYFYFCRKYHDTPGGVKGYNHAPYCEHYEGADE